MTNYRPGLSIISLALNAVLGQRGVPGIGDEIRRIESATARGLKCTRCWSPNRRGNFPGLRAPCQAITAWPHSG